MDVLVWVAAAVGGAGVALVVRRRWQRQRDVPLANLLLANVLNPKHLTRR